MGYAEDSLKNHLRRRRVWKTLLSCRFELDQLRDNAAAKRGILSAYSERRRNSSRYCFHLSFLSCTYMNLEFRRVSINPALLSSLM